MLQPYKINYNIIKNIELIPSQHHRTQTIDSIQPQLDIWQTEEETELPIIQ